MVLDATGFRRPNVSFIDSVNLLNAYYVLRPTLGSKGIMINKTINLQVAYYRLKLCTLPELAYGNLIPNMMLFGGGGF
jgi:hypothetical protein